MRKYETEIIKAGYAFMRVVQDNPANTQLAMVRDNMLKNGMAESFTEWLRDQLKEAEQSALPVVEIECAVGGEAHMWRINGTLYSMPRRSWQFWTFYMVMRDGWSQAGFLYPGARRTNSFTNARSRVVAWLESIGHREIANEVRRCKIAGNMITYDASKANVSLVFK